VISPARGAGPGGHSDAAYLLDSAGPAAPPRDNGELVFAAPWESRAFGVALALHDSGRMDWEDFRRSLIEEIAGWEAAHPSGDGWSYYECWLRSLERVVSEHGLVGAGELRERLAVLAARPAGHDHGEAGGHGHEHR
jgi:nitrile hydratase accessory protein